MAKHRTLQRYHRASCPPPPRRPSASFWLGAAAAGSLLMACSEEPLPTSTAKDRTLSEEVYRILCKRVAKAAYPQERTGARFDAPCDGQAAADITGNTSPEAVRFASIVQHRQITLDTLNEWFGRAQLDGGSTFRDGELDGFLSSIVPFYDKPDEIIPRSTRGIAGVLAKLVDPADPRSQAVLKTLERIGPRKGYRAPSVALGALRPILSYDRLDTLAKTLLTVLGTDGKGKPSAGQPGLLATLRGTALELALPAEPKEPGDSSLDILLNDLLYKPLPGLENAPSAFIVARSDDGNAKLKAGAQGGAGPFPFSGEQGVTRDPDGRLSAVYEYVDVGKSVFAGMVREAKTIATPSFGNQKSALENLGAGLRPIFGTKAQRTQTFGTNNYSFEGAALNDSPLFDLAHALAVLMRYPEVEDAVRLFAVLVDKEEDASASVDRLAVQLHDISKKPEYAQAHLVGTDGTPGTGSDLWDDIIAVGERMLKRNGMLEALIRSFADPAGAKQGALYGTWMRFRDDVPYGGAPLTPPFPANGPNATDTWPTTGDAWKSFYSAEQQRALNTPVNVQYANPVDRAQPDVGMNRSVWQRTLSLINALNGEQICNKKGASLTVDTTLIGSLKFPIDKDGYDECELVKIQDALEIYSKAVAGTATIDLKDAIAVTLGQTSYIGVVRGVNLGDPFGKIQEVYAQITGFNDKPTPASLARFLFAPNNNFMAKLFDPKVAKQGVGIREFEPNGLFHMEIAQGAAGGASLFTAVKPLIAALDTTELRALDGKLEDGYMFGNMLAALHKHWPSRTQLPCALPLPPGLEGCSDANKASKFYAAQSNAVSYEPMLAEMLVDTKATEVLQRAAARVDAVEVNGKKGLTIIANLVKRMLTADPAIAYRDGRKWAATNACVIAGTPDKPACANDTGRIIEQVSPMYLVLDALKGIDRQFDKPENAPKLEAWHAARSAIVDQFLSTDVDPAGKTRLVNQNGRQLGIALANFGADQLKRHREAGDLEAWADGLTKRMLDVLDHPITAGAVSVLEALYNSPDASRELAAVTARITDPDASPRDFAGILTALADTAEFVSKDPDLTPVVQFASLVAAPNAFEALDTQAVPNAEGGAAYAAIELSRAVMSVNTAPEASAISRLLKNIVSPSLAPTRSDAPIERMFDIVGEVNRANPLEPSNSLLKADDYRAVFSQLQKFLTDGDRGLERLYKVIQGRKAN